MKYRIIKFAALLTIMVELSSCFHSVHTTRRTPAHYKYQRAGRHW